jgi:hypothetical protein
VGHFEVASHQGRGKRRLQAKAVKLQESGRCSQLLSLHLAEYLLLLGYLFLDIN